MTRVFSFILGALLLSMAWAVDLPDNARLTLVSDNSVVLGVGVLEDGKLTLTLEAGAEGFITLLIEGADGTIVSLEALLTATGQVLLTVEGGVEDLAVSAVAAGGEVVVAFEDRIAQGVKDITALPQPAQDGIAGAISNHEEAMVNAEEGKAHAGGKAGGEADGEADVDADPEADAGADAEAKGGAETGAENAGANAEVDVEIGVDVGVGVGVGPGGVGQP